MKGNILQKQIRGNKKISYFIGIALIAIVLSITNMLFTQYKLNHPLETDVVKFAKCTDGDTAHFYIDGENVTVRFIAIDTPETVKPNVPIEPYGKEASDRTCELITNAKEIKLEYEETNKIDKYERQLAWIFVDGILLQDDLVSKGLAKVAYIYDNYKYTEKLIKSEQRAKENRIGIWRE
ncbi:MAG: thermonuclease family protein [Erysipelotrichaceae bacterium]